MGVTGDIADAAPRRAAATQLRAGARAFAAGAVEALIGGRPNPSGASSGSAFAMWHGFLTQRVQELAAAVEFDEPALFARQLGWLRSTLDARDIEPADFDASIARLGAAIGDDLPGETGKVVGATLKAALADKAVCAGSPARVDVTDGRGVLAARFLERALSGQTADAVALAASAVNDGVPATDLLERVLMTVQAELGVMWELGEIGIFEEHAATNAVHAAMSIVWHSARTKPVSGSPVLIGSTSGDQHDVGARITAFVIDLAGRSAVCLGADLPPDEFVTAGQSFESCDFVISATMTHHLPRVRETVGLIRAHIEGARVILGGPVFCGEDGFVERMTAKLGADRIVERPSEAAGFFSG